MAFSLTEEQRAAVENRGGGLLVSAAAGSGKTRVLVERLLHRVTAEGRNIDEFLVITYTRAAAEELRSRIAQELSRRLAQSPGDRHLRRQQTLVYKAQISTIHAFCTVLLRECGHLLDLESDFRLCDEGEAQVLMDRALGEVLDRRYETLSPGDDFTFLVDTMSAGRDDSRLVQIVRDIDQKIQSHPHPGAWLDEQERAFALNGVEDAGQTPWGALLLRHARQQAGYCRGQLARALELCGLDPALSRAYAPSLSSTLQDLEDFLAVPEGNWDEAARRAQISFPRLGAARNCADPGTQERVKAIRERCKKRLAGVAELLEGSSAQLLGDMRAVYPAVRALFALVRDFEGAYAAEKNRRGLVDFSDLEHMAVKLLVGEDGEPTPLARQWSGRFTEIMVDEYQDTNEVQNAIFDALSREGKNLFLVGDVKQSIYRFRLADPTIFLEKYRRFQPYLQAKAGEERRILLSRNFRSRPQVLEGANYLFRSLMSEELGEMDYTDQEALYPGGRFPEAEGQEAELDLLDLSRPDGEEEQGEKADKNLLEARFVARRIRAMLEEGQPVTGEGGELRPVRAEDVVILLRSPGSVLHHYAQALGEWGLPWQAEGAEDFFASTEVNVALSLLQIVDNPRQDVALISVLRSPVYGFSGDRLAQLRAGAQGDFYSAVEEAARRGETDCAAFLEELSALRFGAGDRSSHQLIWHIYDVTNLLGLFGAMPDGESRQAHLLTLYELARSFEESGHRGLFGFLSHLERLRASGNRLSIPQAAGPGGGVRILSIHRSKGLEFPVVFLCGLARRFNREDAQKPMLFHPKLGIGPKGLDQERMLEYPTLARRAVARQLDREMMAEELRLLYVAVTRAKDKLVMTCTLTGGMAELKKLEEDSACPVEPQALSACLSVGQWILLAALARPEGEVFRTTPPRRDPKIPLGPAWVIRMEKVEGLEPPDAQEAQEKSRPPEEWGDLSRVLSWTYPHLALAQIPSKLTATQLKGRPLDEEVAEGAGDRKRLSPPVFSHPQWEAGPLTPAQRGTALHLALQCMDFGRADSRQSLQEEIDRLVDEQLLTPQQGEAIEVDRLAAFFNSPLGREIRGAQRLRREFKFSLLVPAADYDPQGEPGEEILLQGVVDLWFETEDGITVVDFKTDRIGPDKMAARAEEYRPQLAAYSRALAQITGVPVVRQILWFFSLNRPYELSREKRKNI